MVSFMQLVYFKYSDLYLILRKKRKLILHNDLHNFFFFSDYIEVIVNVGNEEPSPLKQSIFVVLFCYWGMILGRKLFFFFSSKKKMPLR